MKKKVILSFIIALAMSTSIFMGCASNKTSQNNQDNKKVETSVTQDSSKGSDSKEKENTKDDKIVKEDSSKLQENKTENNKINNDDKNLDKKPTESKEKSDNKVNNSNFTPQNAIDIAKKKYGTANGDIAYSYQEEPHFVNGKKGYYIKLSSKKMIKQGGSGTLTLLLVTSDGKIVEDPR